MKNWKKWPWKKIIVMWMAIGIVVGVVERLVSGEPDPAIAQSISISERESQAAEDAKTAKAESEAKEKELQKKAIQMRDEARLVKDNYRTDVTYEDLRDTPIEYAGELVSLSGTIIQINNNLMRVEVSPGNILMVEFDKKLKLEVDQYITVYGIAQDLYTYPSQGSGDVTIPKIDAFIIE